jgi:replicative DNA helicase
MENMMASSELYLVSKIIQEKDLNTPIKAGLKVDHFTGSWPEIWSWLLEFNRVHGAVPTERVFNQEFGDVTLEDASGETFSRLIEEVVAGFRRRTIMDSLSHAIPAIDANNLEEAMAALSVGLQKASVDAARLRDIDIIQNWENRMARYEVMRNTPNALRGIPTGFHGLDKITHGLRPQQFIVFAGEPKRGKSLFALILANSAHIHGKRPLFVSFEMSIEEQEARYDSLISKVPYTRILSGDLNNDDMVKIRKALSIRKNMHPFVFSEDTSSLTTVTALAGKVQEYQPDVLFVDGVYLMDDEEGEAKGSPQALTNITRSLKRLAQRFDIPVVATTQVLSWKLGNKKTRAVTADAIGYTSSFAQDADLILGVERNPDMEDQAIIRVVLVRTAPTGEVHVKWDWTTMEFEEVSDYDDHINPSFD